MFTFVKINTQYSLISIFVYGTWDYFTIYENQKERSKKLEFGRS